MNETLLRIAEDIGCLLLIIGFVLAIGAGCFTLGFEVGVEKRLPH